MLGFKLGGGLFASIGQRISQRATIATKRHRAADVRRSRRGRMAIFESMEGRVFLSVAVTTQHYDNYRSGANTQETILTLDNVTPSTFAKLFTQNIDGYAYAEPLYVPNVTIPGKGVHNVVFVATQHNSVYAFDADSNSGANATPLWKVSFIDPANGITTVPTADVGTSDIVPEIGITGTPVIDPATGTLYVVAKTKEVTNGVTSYAQRLHALDITTGQEKLGGPVLINPTYPGVGTPNDGNGNVLFSALKQLQRPALTLANGKVYVGFASHGDGMPYHGWIVGYDAASLQQTAVWNSSPDTSRSGIWQSGSGFAVDSSGDIYITTGNGPFNADTGGKSYGDSVVRLRDDGSGVLKVVDYFTPYNQASLNLGDNDLGSGGPVLIDQGDKRLLITGGKDATLYVIDRDNMGGYNGVTNTNLQTVVSQVGRLYGAPSYFNGSIYVNGRGDYTKQFSLTDGVLSNSPVSTGNSIQGYPGLTTVVTSNGNTNGILWIYANGNSASQLTAYDASDLTKKLYTSTMAGNRDTVGPGVKFSTPTVVNGKVYLGTQSQLVVYGNFNIPATIPNPPSNLQTVAQSGNSVRLTWNDNSGNETGFRIERSTDGDNFTQIGLTNPSITLFIDESAAANTSYTYRVKATSSVGDSAASAVSNVTTPAVAALAGQWNLDEGVGLSTADVSGNNNNGALVDEVTWIDGRVGAGALNFHGAGVQDAHVGMADSATLRFASNQSYSLSAWVNPTYTPSKWVGIVTKASESSAGYGIYIDPQGRWSFASSSGVDAITGSTATPGWHFVTAVQDGQAGTRTLYVDGSAVVSGTAISSDGEGELWLGGSKKSNTEYFNGGIDEVRLLSRAMTLTEVQTLANFYNPTLAPDNLVASAVSSSQINLSWGNTAPNATGYRIERSVDNNLFYEVAVVNNPTATSYEDKGLPSATTFYYRIRATNAAGNSDYSNTSFDTVQLAPAVGDWQFIEGDGTIVADTSGYGNTGVLVGSADWTDEGRIDFGVELDGEADYLKFPDAASLNPTEAIALSIWVNAETWAGRRTLISKGLGGSQFSVVEENGAITFAIPGVGSVSTASVPSLESWHHVAAVYDGALLSIYIDGSLAGTAAGTGAISVSTQPLVIGASDATATPSAFFSGTIDEIQMFPRSLSNTEIASLASPTQPPEAPSALQVTVVSPTRVDLSWTPDPTNLEEGFKVERSTDEINFTTIVTTAKGASSFIDTTVKPGSVYYYQVRATNSGGDSDYTFAVSAVTAPSNVVATPITAGRVDVSWTGFAPLFRVERSIADGSFTQIGTSTTTSFSDSNTLPGTSYAYRVLAARNADVSAPSAAASALTPLGPNYAAFTDATGLQLNKGAAISNTRLTLTNSVKQSRSAFYTTKVGVSSFSTSFDFQLINPQGDGFTFTIQNKGTTAVGSALGYSGITNSVAVRFNIASNTAAGVGSNSTGVLVNGVYNAAMANSFSGTAIDLKNQHTFRATLNYTGGALYVNVTDLTTGGFAVNKYTVDIPSIVGGNTAFVGFTGGTGGYGSTQQILNWSFNQAQPVPTAPTLVTPIAITSPLVKNKTGALSVLATDAGGESKLTYSWKVISAPIGAKAPNFSSNYTNASKNTNISFNLAGTYTLQLTVSNGSDNLIVPYVYTVQQVLSSMLVKPGRVAINPGASVLFASQARDQFGQTMSVTPSITWAIAPGGAGSIVSSTGLYTAPASGTVGATVTATSGAIVGKTYISLLPTTTLNVTGSTPVSALSVNGGATVVNGRIQLTNGQANQARSAFTVTPVNVATFNANFTFQITKALSDGLTFTIQNVSAGSVGATGSGLGYQGIGKSIAVKFDLYSDAGEGTSSTGLYLNGAKPTTPATDLLASGIDLHSGHVFSVNVGYDGSLLSVQITDTLTSATASQQYAVNLAAILGDTKGFVGFTAGTHLLSSVQEILSLSFNS